MRARSRRYRNLCSERWRRCVAAWPWARHMFSQDRILGCLRCKRCRSWHACATGTPAWLAAARMQATAANRAYCQKSSVCRQETSSSKSGSVPPWTAAAASTAYWIFLQSRLRKAHSARNRSRSPSKRSGQPGWPRTSPARPQQCRGTPRRGKCCSPGAELQARSPARRRHRRGRACRAGHGERRQRHQRSAVSWQAYPDTKARPPTASHGRPADRRRDSPVRKRRYSAPPPARPSRRFLASSTTCVNRRSVLSGVKID